MTAAEEILLGLAGARAELEAALRPLAPAALERPAALGEWSVRDMLLHLAGWDRASREALSRVLAEDNPVFERYEGAGWDWSEWNRRFIAGRDGITAVQALAELGSERQALRALVAPLSDEQLRRRARMPWDYELSVAEVLAVQTQHDREHAAQIRALISLSPADYLAM